QGVLARKARRIQFPRLPDRRDLLQRVSHSRAASLVEQGHSKSDERHVVVKAVLGARSRFPEFDSPAKEGYGFFHLTHGSQSGRKRPEDWDSLFQISGLDANRLPVHSEGAIRLASRLPDATEAEVVLEPFGRQFDCFLQ